MHVAIYIYVVVISVNVYVCTCSKVLKYDTMYLGKGQQLRSVAYVYTHATILRVTGSANLATTRRTVTCTIRVAGEGCGCVEIQLAICGTVSPSPVLLLLSVGVERTWSTIPNFCASLALMNLSLSVTCSAHGRECVCVCVCVGRGRGREVPGCSRPHPPIVSMGCPVWCANSLFSSDLSLMISSA